MMTKGSQRRQRGFALIAALFFVVVIAMAGVGVSAINRTQHLAEANEQLGVQAYWAAMAGIEYGIHHATVAAGAPTCPASTVLTPPQWGGRFQINVTCTQFTTGTATEYEFLSLATALGGEPIEREILARVARTSATPANAALTFIRERY